MPPTPNLLAALKAHLQTGEIPETLRESLGGTVRTSPIPEGDTPQQFASPAAAQSLQSLQGGAAETSMAAFVERHVPQRPAQRRAAAPRDRVVTTGRKLSIDDLDGGSDGDTTDRAGGADRADAADPAGGDAALGVAGAADGARRPAGAPGPQPPIAAHGIVAAKLTSAGEVEVPLPDPAAITAARAEITPFALPRFGEGDLQTQRRIGIRTGQRASTYDVLKASRGENPWGHGEEPGRPEPHLTTDETLEADLRASLAAVGATLEGDLDADQMAALDASQPPAPTYDLPVDLADLPLFAYVSGPGGVGKTFWAKEVARRAGEAVILAATTGIASVNLGEGTTINALLRYFDTASLRDAYTSGFLEATLKRLRNTGLQRILLDEVSMLHAEQLTILCRAIDNVNQDKPEGVPDLGLIALGDFGQLPPVPDRDPKDPTGRKKLPVQMAFESPEWGRFAEHHWKLTTIRRQADADFIRALLAVRRGAVGEALEFFRPHFVPTTDQDFPGPTIVAKNEAVGKYNQLRLDQVKGPVVEFTSERWGKVRPEWGGPPKPEADWGVPKVLRLKIGARVLILANLNLTPEEDFPLWAYTNGDLGTLVDVRAGAPVVKLDRTGTDVTLRLLNRFNEIPMEPGRPKALRAEGHADRISKDGKKEYIGGITYYPLRLAYATTVHRSQGLSLDKVQVAIRDPFFAQPSMLYVALSRARSVEGLRLVGTPEGFRARCTVNPKIKEFV